MKERIKYIDSLKGLAILLMVMGHVIASQFSDMYYALNDAPRATMFLWRFIYSFHMPLFMFCSGLFVISGRVIGVKDIGLSIWKRVKSLLFPAIFTGGILWLLRGSFGYWFLWILFQYAVLTLALYMVCCCIPRYGKHIFAAIICIISLAIMRYISLLMPYERLPLLDVEHWSLYPYFCVGILCKQYNLLERYLSKNIVYTIAIALFGFLTYWMTISGYQLPAQSLTGCMLPLSAIVALVYLFKTGLTGDTKAENWLQNLGTSSLEVYILHLFFLPAMSSIGEYVLNVANVGGGAQTILFAQFITSLIISVVIIYMCYIVMSVINKSNILSQLLLGRKSVINEK